MTLPFVLVPCLEEEVVVDRSGYNLTGFTKTHPNPNPQNISVLQTFCSLNPRFWNSGTCMHAYSPGGPSDEDDGENEPEHVAEDDHFHHVQVRPVHIEVKGQTGQQMDRETGKQSVGGAYLHIMKSGTVLRRSRLIRSDMCPSSSSSSQLSPARIWTDAWTSSSNTCSCREAPRRSRKSSGKSGDTQL